MVKSLATLTVNGYITEPNSILVKQFKYFLNSDKNQCSTIKGVQSLPWLVAKYHSDPDNLATMVQIALQTMYRNFFNNVSVDCRTKDVDTDGRYILEISVVITEPDDQYELKRALEVTNDSISEIGNGN